MSTRASRDQRGSAYVIAVFLLAVLSLLAVGVVTTATTDLKISDNYVRSMRNFYVADAGASHAVAMMEADPSTGDLAPYPSGTPLRVGQLGENTYSIWLWNRRVNGNGSVIDFDKRESRQFVVEGRDRRRGVRRLAGIIEPYRNYPEALDRSIFSCRDVSLTSGSDEVQGDVYSGGNVSWDARSVKTVNVDARGTFTNSAILSGSVAANGAIRNNSRAINGFCRTASGTIDRTSNCKAGYAMNVSPSPVKEYCNAASADWDPGMLNFTTTETANIRAATDAMNVHASGWSVTTDTLLGDTSYYVVGNATFSNMRLTYTGNTVLVVENGDFLCSNCVVAAAAGAPSWSTITIVTTSGDIVFTSGSTNNMEFQGVLWAGVPDGAGVMPARGSVSVTGNTDVKLIGEVVATGSGGSGVQVGSSAGLMTYLRPAKPPVFGQLSGFAITEWREDRP